MEKHSIELFGLTLLEPSTYLSDIALTIFSLGLYFALRRSFPTSDYGKKYSFFFLFLSLSTIIGGHAHLFGHYIDNYLFHALAWSFSSTGIYFLQVGSAYDYNKGLRSKLNMVFLIQLVISVGIYFGYQLFGNVVVDHTKVGTPGFQAAVVSMAIAFLGFIAPLHANKFIKEKDNGSAIFLMGLICSIAAPIIQGKQWGIGKYFNHNDVAHLVLMVCYYIYFLAIRIKVQNYESVTEEA